MKGTMIQHGTTCGYIVVGSHGHAGSVCHGWNDPRKERILLGGNPATLFSSRAVAKRAIKMNDEALKDCPRPAWNVVRVAYVKEGVVR